MAILTMREGISTEEVLFTIASDQIHTHAVEELAQLANTEILQCASAMNSMCVCCQIAIYSAG